MNAQAGRLLGRKIGAASGRLAMTWREVTLKLLDSVRAQIEEAEGPMVMAIITNEVGTNAIDFRGNHTDRVAIIELLRAIIQEHEARLPLPSHTARRRGQPRA